MKKPFQNSTLIMAVCCIAVTSCQTPDRYRISRADSLPETTPWDLAALSKPPEFEWSEGVDTLGSITEGLSEPPEFEWSEGEQIRSLYYEGEAYKGKNTRVFAYYATPGTLSGDPSKDENLPAIVLVHGGGGTAFPSWTRLWASRGYAAIAMDLAGCGPERVKLDDGGPDQSHDLKFGAIDGPITDQWPYHAVANVIRAHSLILSFPEVDADRTALTGISWGGYLTCIVAGIDNRFKAAVPVYGCGFLAENSAWVGNFSKMSPENRAKWTRLWDPSRYVGSATMPMLFVNGGKDFAYPPDSYAKTYDLVRSPKNMHFVPELKHSHIFDRPKAIEVFLDHQLRNGIPLPKISSPHVGKGQIEATVDTETALVSAELHYTVDALPGIPKDREWTTLPVELRGTKIVAELPPENTTIWFLTVKDEKETMVSSTLNFPEGHKEQESE